MNRCNYSRKAPPPAGRHVNMWLDLLEGHVNEPGMTQNQVHQCKHKLNEAIFTSKAPFSILRNCSTATKRMLGRLSREVPPTKRKILDRAGWVRYKRVLDHRPMFLGRHSILGRDYSTTPMFRSSSQQRCTSHGTEGRSMASSALPCASDWGKAKARANTGTKTVPPPT